MKGCRILFPALMVLSAHSVAWATWSVVAIDKKTGDVIVASATCVAQAGFLLAAAGRFARS